MVIIVAAVLSFIALQLKPVQQKNIELEQMQNILAAVNIESTVKNVEDEFKKYITNSFVVNISGDTVESAEAITINMQNELNKILEIKNIKSGASSSKMSPFKKFLSRFITFETVNIESLNKKTEDIKTTRLLPVYVCLKDTTNYYVFPLRGKGLWGPIWGYISLEGNFNTVYGANFDHKSETPGLGAEIKENWFEAQFKGKRIFDDNNKFISVKVLKGGGSEGNPYAVDAISGGTITSKGLEAMIFDCMYDYQNYIKRLN